MCDWIPGAEKSPDRIDALVCSLSILKPNAYAGSDFCIPNSYMPDEQGVDYSFASSYSYKNIWSEDDY